MKQALRRIVAWSAVAVVGGAILVLLGYLYAEPAVLLTKSVSGSDEKTRVRVEAENAVRANIIQAAGGFFLLGTLVASIWNAALAARNTRIAQERLEDERKNQWRGKVRDSYAEWVGLFEHANRIGCELAMARKDGKPDLDHLSQFNETHRKMEMCACKIRLLEERPQVRKAFDHLYTERFPNDPCHKRGNENSIELFWQGQPRGTGAEKKPEVIGGFRELTHKRLIAFADWFKKLEAHEDQTTEDFRMLCGHEYVCLVNEKLKLSEELQFERKCVCNTPTVASG